jgi:hypothetical protein
MKKILKNSLLILAISSLVILSGCPKPAPEPSKYDQGIANLTNKAGGWTGSVTVPVGSATTTDQWSSFKVTFTKTNMTTSGFPTGAGAVWPSGTYTLNTDATQITRASDGVVMQVTSLTETSLTVRFTVPEGVVLGGRVQVLSGEYTFTLN